MRSIAVVLLALSGCSKPAPVPSEPEPVDRGVDRGEEEHTAATEGEREAVPFDQASIDEEVRARLVDLRACYDTRAERNPELQGVITARFVIDDQGRARDIELESETLDDDELDACLAGVLSSIAFPPAPSSEAIAVTYPFEFRPD